MRKTIGWLHAVAGLGMVLLVSLVHPADSLTGRDLLEICERVPIERPNDVDLDAATCVHYFEGVVDAATIYTAALNREGIELGGAFEAPNCGRVSINELVTATKKFLIDRPDFHDQLAVPIILMARYDAFCDK